MVLERVEMEMEVQGGISIQQWGCMRLFEESFQSEKVIEFWIDFWDIQVGQKGREGFVKEIEDGVR